MDSILVLTTLFSLPLEPAQNLRPVLVRVLVGKYTLGLSISKIVSMPALMSRVFVASRRFSGGKSVVKSGLI